VSKQQNLVAYGITATSKRFERQTKTFVATQQ